MPTENYLKSELTQLIQTDESTWEFLQAGSLDGVWYWDIENPDQEWMSPEFWHTLGIDPASKRHLSSEWQDLIFQEDLALALENFQAHCEDPSHPYDQIVRYHHADGSTVWIRCRGLAIRDAEGKPVRMLGAHTDVTALKLAEENARAGWRAAEAANEELRTFAYAISHDMKAPANTLQLLLSELELSAGDVLNEDATELLSMANQTVGRMRSLIEKVLDYTRVIGMETAFDMVDLGEVAQQAMANLHGDIETSGAQITVDPLPCVYASHVQMSVLFQNVLNNAIKYCTPGNTPLISITHRGDAPPDTVLITFKDNGIGIPPEHHDKIFKLFQRLHGQDEFEGVGIGLPMCLRIALNHGGNLTVCSTPGDGAAFTLSLREKLP